MVAVGTALTGGPPRRSVRAELPHTAPALGPDVQALGRIGMQDPGWGKPGVGIRCHPGPGPSASSHVATTSKSAVPHAYQFAAEPADLFGCPWNGVVVRPPAKDRREPRPLRRARQVHALAKARGNCLERPPDAFRHRTPLNDELTVAGHAADMREAQEVKRRRLPFAPPFTIS